MLGGVASFDLIFNK